MLDWLPVGLADWGAESFVALICVLILTERLVGRGRLTEKNEEIALWRSKSETETAINAENAKSIANFANAAILKEEVRKAVRAQRLRDEEIPSMLKETSPEGSDA